MTNLEELNLTNLQAAVNCYRNLFYHRTAILEGIRKIAYRNMAHVSEAIKFLRANGNAFRDNQCVKDIQGKMLADQGLEDNQLNRMLIGWGTYYSIQLYHALLYAEVEFYQKFCTNSGILTDDVFSVYLNTRTEFTGKLHRFRDFFLHPSKENVSAESDFMSYNRSYNLAPELQGNLDQYLNRTRLKVLDNLKSILSSLPEYERQYCNLLFLYLNSERMEDFHDVDGMKNLAGQFRDLQKQMIQVPAESRPRPPSQKQKQMALALTKLINEVSPSGPEQQFTNLGTKQTPMNRWLLPLIMSDKVPHSYGNTRTGIHVGKNVRLLKGILITVGVLLNEAVTVRGKYPLEKLFEHAKKMPLEELAESVFNDTRQKGLQHSQEIASLYRVSTALLYEPLCLYEKVRRENDSISIQGLDIILSRDRLENLRVFRHSVFHVFKQDMHPVDVDLARTDPILLNLGMDLYMGLSEFFGALIEPWKIQDDHL